MRTKRLLEKTSRDLRMLTEAQEDVGNCCVWAQAGGLAPVSPLRTAEPVNSHSVPRCAMALVGSPTRWPPAPQPFTCNSSCLMWPRWVWDAAQGPLFPCSLVPSSPSPTCTSLDRWHFCPQTDSKPNAFEGNPLKDVYCRLFMRKMGKQYECPTI